MVQYDQQGGMHNEVGSCFGQCHNYDFGPGPLGGFGGYPFVRRGFGPPGYHH
jgi:hypothetical protein